MPLLSNGLTSGKLKQRHRPSKTGSLFKYFPEVTFTVFNNP